MSTAIETNERTYTEPREQLAAELRNNLPAFSGTENYYRHWTRRLVYTDGVQYLAEKAGAYWLIDAIASHQNRRVQQVCDGMQIWTLKVDHSGKRKGTMRSPMAVLTGSRDRTREGEPVGVAARQAIPYTDFPMDEIVLYVCGAPGNLVLMLRSEY